MRPASFITKVGSTAAGRDGRSEVVVFSEPEVGATLRTRGRLYLLCEVDPPSRSGVEIAAEIAEMVRQEYYYDLSAGIEVALRRALRKANRRASQQLREHHGRLVLHCACAIVVNREVYAARVGSAHVFLVRHARLFLPGDEPDELADFVHRTTTRNAASLGAEPDLLPLVWRQAIDAGDTVILASGSVVDALGAEALKNAAVTLHPRAAAEHVRNRFVAEGAHGSDATIFIEVAPAPSAAARVAAEPEPIREPEEVLIAETIRWRLDAVWRRRPRMSRIARSLASPFVGAIRRAFGVGLELMPRRQTALPRRPESARVRTAKLQRLVTLLALLLLLVAIGIGAVVVRDYQANQVVSDYRIAIVAVESDIASARTLVTRKDVDAAWERLGRASTRLDEAARSTAADALRVEQLRDEIRSLEDKLNSVLIDLASVERASAPAKLTQTVNGLYAADPGAGRLWRIHGDPVVVGIVLRQGAGGMARPAAVVAQGEALLALDAARRLWRAEGDTVAEITLPRADSWRSATDLATFGGNVYVLDGDAGQLWRYEPAPRGGFQAPAGFLPSPLPSGAARAVAVDGDIWILTSSGEIQRYRRQGVDATLTRLPFVPRWSGAQPRAVALQGLESQRFLWLLDAPARQVVQLARDGREIARFALPERLPEPTAFFVSEWQRIAYTVHGSKIAATDIIR